jgi:hypothetical protein
VDSFRVCWRIRIPVSGEKRISPIQLFFFAKNPSRKHTLIQVFAMKSPRLGETTAELTAELTAEITAE